MLTLLLSACGGTGDYVSPPTSAPVETTTTGRPTTTATTSTTTTSTTTTSTTTATTAPATGIRERRADVTGSAVTIRSDDGMAPNVVAMVEETLAVAREDFGDSGTLVVHVYADADTFVDAHDVRGRERARTDVEAGLVASSSTGVIWIYGPAFVERDLTTRRLIVLHEYFHTVQTNLSGNRSGRAPVWLREGSARYFEFRGAADSGYTDFARRRQSEIRQSRTHDPLSAFETTGGATFRGESGGAYIVGFLACDYLVNTKGVEPLERDFWVQLRSASDWRTAFANAFGIDVDQFYVEFEEYRETL